MNDHSTLIIIAVALVAAALAAWLLLGSGRRGKERPPVLSERSGDERPYVRKPEPQDHGGGLADEVATATTDVYADVLNVERERRAEGGDDLERLKGVGPKLAARLGELGITTYAQLAGLGENEIAVIDSRLGPFQGRIARDRLVEQAHYLARGDTDGFEERFGRLGG
jgi:predicted flap endonuclease-1-like 5' DNA nuclease